MEQTHSITAESEAWRVGQQWGKTTIDYDHFIIDTQLYTSYVRDPIYLYFTRIIFNSGYVRDR